MIKITAKNYFNENANAILIDLTQVWNKLSPYYPHGDIPIINTPNLCLNSVNEVWQSLCSNKKPDGEYKDVLFRKGIGINEYYTYEEARREILIPTYRWMLENKAYEFVCKLREFNEKGGTIVFIDKTTNTDIADVSQPLSFACLLKAYIECTFPYENAMEEYGECKHVLVGHKEGSIIVKRKRPSFISINTDAQRRLDF